MEIIMNIVLPVDEFKVWLIDYLKEETGKEDIDINTDIYDLIDSLDIMTLLLDAEEKFFAEYPLPDDIVKIMVSDPDTVEGFTIKLVEEIKKLMV